MEVGGTVLKRFVFQRPIPRRVEVDGEFTVLVAVTDELGTPFYFGEYCEKLTVQLELVHCCLASGEELFSHKLIEKEHSEEASQRYQIENVDSVDQNTKGDTATSGSLQGILMELSAFGRGLCEFRVKLRERGVTAGKKQAKRRRQCKGKPEDGYLEWLQLRVSTPGVHVQRECSVSSVANVSAVSLGSGDLGGGSSESGAALLIHPVYSEPFRVWPAKRKNTRKKTKVPLQRYCYRRIAVTIPSAALPLDIGKGCANSEETFVLSIRERQQFGVLGCQLWNASLVTANYLIAKARENSGVLKGATVLELGSGCGFVGAVCYLLGVRRIVMSDVEDVFPYLRFNIDAAEEVSKKRALRSCVLSWECVEKAQETPEFLKRLLWDEQEEREPKKHFELDYILASDVLYNSSIYGLLATTLACLTAAGHTQIIIGQSNRVDDERPEFFHLCKANGIECTQKLHYGDSYTLFLLEK